jgi:hypothetical protein
MLPSPPPPPHTHAHKYKELFKLVKNPAANFCCRIVAVQENREKIKVSISKLNERNEFLYSVVFPLRRIPDGNSGRPRAALPDPRQPQDVRM